MTDVPRPGSDAAASDPGAAATRSDPGAAATRSDLGAAATPSTAGVRRVLVTGAGGKTGQAVIAALRVRGVHAVGLVRSEQNGRRLVAAVAECAPDAPSIAAGEGPADRSPSAAVGGGARPGVVTWAVGDQRLVADLIPAMDGCDAVYAIAPNMSPDELPMARALLAACRERGIERIAYHSVLDPDEPAMPHHLDKARVESMVAADDWLAWTFVRSGAYQQNLAGYVQQFRAGFYAVPYDLDRPHAMVDLGDVAEVAADCLADGSGIGYALELAGPELLTAHDIARTAGELLGHEVVAQRLDPDDWAAADGALPPETRRRLLAMFAHYDRYGFPGDPAPLRALLGRPPGRLRDTLAALLH